MGMAVKRPLPVKNGKPVIKLGLGLLAGLAVGGVAVMLLTPRSGREMRTLIRTRTIQAKDHIVDEARKAVAATRESYYREHGHAPPD
jgi:gas vesicle protein